MAKRLLPNALSVASGPEDLPEHFSAPTAHASNIQAAEGLVATRVAPHRITITEAYAKGMRPARKGSGMILDEDQLVADPDSGILLDGEMLVFVERTSHHAERMQALHDAAMRQRDMIAATNQLGEALAQHAPGARVTGGATFNVDAPEKPLPPAS